jgi:hypothetical protein
VASKHGISLGCIAIFRFSTAKLQDAREICSQRSNQRRAARTSEGGISVRQCRLEKDLCFQQILGRVNLVGVENCCDWTFGFAGSAIDAFFRMNPKAF